MDERLPSSNFAQSVSLSSSQNPSHSPDSSSHALPSHSQTSDLRLQNSSQVHDIVDSDVMTAEGSSSITVMSLRTGVAEESQNSINSNINAFMTVSESSSNTTQMYGPEHDILAESKRSSSLIPTVDDISFNKDLNKISNSCSFNVMESETTNSTMAMTDKENVGIDDLKSDFYNSLVDSNMAVLENLVFRNNVDVNLTFDSSLGFVKRKFFGWRPLHIAASKGCVKIIEFLLHQGSNVHLLTPDGDTALHTASKSGAAEVVQLLLEFDIFLRDRPNHQGITALMKAVFNSQHAFKGAYHTCVNLLLAAGCNPNISSSSLMTPLHVAVNKGDVYLVKKLISSGANVNAICDQGTSPLCHALKSQYINAAIITSLLEANADTNFKMNERPLLHIAIHRCDDRIIETFVKCGANVNSQDSSGLTSLWVAVEENNIKVVPILVNGGADVNYVRYPQGHSILSQAVFTNSIAMVKLLLDFGASPFTESIMWWTPLHQAVSRQNLDMVRHLIAANCPLNTTSNAKFSLKPMTPVQIAMETGSIEIILLLIQSGASIKHNWMTKDRLSPALLAKPEYLACIERYVQEIPSLLHLTRVNLREFLGERFKVTVSQICAQDLIPKKLIDYLYMRDILDVEEQ